MDEKSRKKRKKKSSFGALFNRHGRASFCAGCAPLKAGLCAAGPYHTHDRAPLQWPVLAVFLSGTVACLTSTTLRVS